MQIKEFSPTPPPCSSFEELCSLVDTLPGTIKGITVQSSLDEFNPPLVRIEPTCSSWREEVKRVVSDALALPGGSNVDRFMIRSFYGEFEPLTASYYLELSSPASRDFGRRMSAGEFGRLD